MLYASNADTIRRHELEDRSKRFRAYMYIAPTSLEEFSRLPYAGRAACKAYNPDLYALFTSMERGEKL